LKADLDLKLGGDIGPYVKGLLEEKPQACLNRIEVSKAVFESKLPETPPGGEIVKNPKEGSA